MVFLKKFTGLLPDRNAKTIEPYVKFKIILAICATARIINPID